MGGLLRGYGTHLLHLAAVAWPEDFFDSLVGDFFLTADALGVDAEEDFDAVVGALGGLGGETPPLSERETAAWRRSYRQGRCCR
jgi:hypothetical protein